jgi:hypothetical protein
MAPTAKESGKPPNIDRGRSPGSHRARGLY